MTKAESEDAREPKPEELAAARERMMAAFGACVAAMMTTARYRHIPLAELSSLLMEPLMRGRVAVANAMERAGDGESAALSTGVAIWASLDEEAEGRLREQTGAGVFPPRLKPADWTSGSTVWLLDVIAPNPDLAAAVVANFRQVCGARQVKIHPAAARAVGREALDRLGEVAASTSRRQDEA